MDNGPDGPNPGNQSMAPWLLCDYGMVLSLPQSLEDEIAIASVAGLELDQLRTRYWSRRDDYDRGDVSCRSFWEGVCEEKLDVGRLAQLVALDVASWAHLRAPSIEAVERARRRGYRLALLSNAPLEVARALEHLPFLERFEVRLFSCDVGEIKPSRAVYEAALHALRAPPDKVIFFDDKEPNVLGARACGMAAERFADPSQFDALPDPRPGRRSAASP